MDKTPKNTKQKEPTTSKKSSSATPEDALRHLAFDNSLQPNVITAVSSGKIIMANSAACKFLGYSKKELLTKRRSAIFNIDEHSFKKMLNERTAQGHSTALVTAITKNGKSIPCEITSAVFMDTEGIEKSISTIADMRQSISKQKKIDVQKEKIVANNISIAKSKQRKIDIKKEKVVADNIMRAQVQSDMRLAENDEEHSEIFLLTSKLSFDGIWDWNVLTNEFFLGKGFEELFGHAMKTTTGMMADWSSHLHPDDKEVVQNGLQSAIASSATHWEHTFRFVRADGSIAKVIGRASIIRDADGKALRMIGVIHDLSRQKELEEKLEQEIKSKGMQIAEATEDAKDAERSDIGKELHDNVNQLLAASKMYLSMAKRGGKDSNMYLSRSSEYTNTAMEEIRKLTHGLTTDIIHNLGLCTAISNITRDMMEVNPIQISNSLESFIENSVTDKFKLTIFRIVQEQLSNILKHAKATDVAISLVQNEKSITLTISDNGVGFDTGKKRKGIGVDNIKSRAASYNGTATFVSKPGKGCVLTVTVPVTDAL